MSNRAIFLVVLTAILGAAALWFHDFFKSEKIEILVQLRPQRGAPPSNPGDVPVDPVTFAFPERLNLTEVRVVAAEDEATNKYPHAVWHLISDNTSEPVKVLIYGQEPKGMKPKTPKARAEPLEPGVVYHLYVEAGKAKGEKKFHTREAVSVSRTP